jgi:hypothetical protein
MPWRDRALKKIRGSLGTTEKDEIAPKKSETTMRSGYDSPDETGANVRERYGTRRNERDGLDAISWRDRGKSNKISRGLWTKTAPQVAKYDTIRSAKQQ